MGSRDRDRRKKKREEARRRRASARGPIEPMADPELLADAGILAADDMATKVAAWCEKRGIEPHAQLEAAAGLMYVVMLQHSAAGEEIGPEELQASMAKLAAAYQAQSGESNVMEAAEQITQFLLETPLDDVLMDAEDDDDVDEIEPTPPHVQKMLQQHGAIMAKAVGAYLKSKGLTPASFEDLQLGAVHSLMEVIRFARADAVAPILKVLELVRADIHEIDHDRPEYLKAVDQVIDLQLAIVRDRKLGEWVVEQLSGEYDENELRDKFVK